MGRAREYEPLTPEDWELIQACQEERERLLRQIKILKAMGAKRHKAEIAQLVAERKQLTDESLARKFETSKYAIGQL